jgi:lipid-A-disaccharide synthase
MITRVAIVAGEASGDQIGADLIDALRARHPGVDVFGMAGPRMRAAGCRALADTQELAVMGLFEVLRHYPRLRRLRQRLIAEILASRPDVVVGIDVPDFNLGIEREARRAGIPAVHYVCPQVWAWRAGRLPAIRSATDLILALFPFEVPFLAQHGIESVFVGHPLADRIAPDPDREAAQRALLPDPGKGQLVALMPGSRRQELHRHAALFLAAASALARQQPATRFVIGALDDAGAAYLAQLPALRDGAIDVRIVTGQATRLLVAADAALVASGTVTLEAALCGTPAVVAYRLATPTWWLMRRSVKVPHVSLPNLLLGRRLLPEFLQDAATPDALASALRHWLEDPAAVADYRTHCAGLHRELRAGSGAAAVSALEQLLERRQGSGR